MDQGAAKALSLHQQRRTLPLPTVSVLLADERAAEAVWSQWVTDARPHLRDTGLSARDLVCEIIRTVSAATDLPAFAMRHLERSAGNPSDAVRPTPAGRTAHDLETLAEAALGAGAAIEPTRAALQICRAAVANASPSDIVDRINRVLSDTTAIAWWRVLAAIDPLLPGAILPGILLAAPSEADSFSWLCNVARTVEHLTLAVPRWAVAVAISPGVFDRYCRETPPSRVKSLLQSGIISLGIDSSIVGGADGPAVLPADGIPAPIRSLKAIAASTELVAAFKTAEALQPHQDEEARSAAERFLFELLESHPASKGQFVLNASPGFDFGPRAAEVDLLAVGLRLAVEVDGYHHFTDPISYRRDRRKDWELQRYGFRVVRVLADDVVTRMDEVLDFILVSIEHCERQPMDKDFEP